LLKNSEKKLKGLKRKLYELKHTGAGRAIEAGANIRDVQLHLRHSNINTTEIYLKAFRSSTSEEFIKNFPKL
jgi:site-specific recombinase XerD